MSSTSYPSDQSDPSFFEKHLHTLIGLGLWLLILAGYWGYTIQNNLSPWTTARLLGAFLQESVYGPPLFLAIYLIRPLLLFPTSIITLLAGFLFGPVWGSVYALSGNVISGMVAYLVGAYFGKDFLQFRNLEGMMARYTDYIRANSFEAILVMRLILLHFDSVSYLAGFLRVKWQGYLWATALGSVAGVVSYVLAGASVEGEFTGQLPSLNPWMISLAALLFGASYALAWLLRRWKRPEQQDEANSGQENSR